jgi:hypothetical protein
MMLHRYTGRSKAGHLGRDGGRPMRRIGKAKGSYDAEKGYL